MAKKKMNIEALAKKAGMVSELQSGAASCVWTAGLTAVSADQLTAFACLVAVEEREACAKQLWDMAEQKYPLNKTTRGADRDALLAADALREGAYILRACSNVEGEGPAAALSRTVPSTAGLAGRGTK